MEDAKKIVEKVVSSNPTKEGEIKPRKLVPKEKKIHQVDDDPKYEEKKSPPHKHETHGGSTLNENFRKRLRKPSQKSPRFEDTHKRFTNYLEKDLYMIIQNLRKKDAIDSLTILINNAVYEYLTNYFPNEFIKKN
jgi:hypothetical protein